MFVAGAIAACCLVSVLFTVILCKYLMGMVIVTIVCSSSHGVLGVYYGLTFSVNSHCTLLKDLMLELVGGVFASMSTVSYFLGDKSEIVLNLWVFRQRSRAHVSVYAFLYVVVRKSPFFGSVGTMEEGASPNRR